MRVCVQCALQPNETYSHQTNVNGILNLHLNFKREQDEGEILLTLPSIIMAFFENSMENDRNTGIIMPQPKRAPDTLTNVRSMF